MIVAPGATSVSVDVRWLDDTGAAVTGKVAADFPVCKWSGGSNTADTTITLSDLAAITTAHPNDNTAGGVKEREGGWYRLDLPNNMLTSAGRKTLTFAETTNKRIDAPFIDCQYVQADAEQWKGGTIPTPTVTGVPNVNTKTINDVSTSPVTTIKAVQGLAVDGVVTTVTNQLTAAQIATGVWQDATSGDFTVASSIGKCLYIANIAPGSANGLATVGASLTIGTNNDKTGYSLSVTPPTAAAIATAVWQDSTAGDFTVASSIGKTLYIANIAPGSANGLATVGASLTVGTNNDKTGYSLSVTPPTAAAIATAVWQDTTAGDFTTAGSIGKGLFTSGAVPGATGGLIIAGSNAATTFATLTVTGATTLAAVGLTTFTASGAVAFQSTLGITGAVTLSSNLSVGGTTTLTGAVTATNASNSITGVGITSNVKKNQALSSFVFLMTDSTTHAPATGLTVAVTRSIDGGAFAAGTLSSVTEISAGNYKVDFGAADMNGNVIVLKATASGADTTEERIITAP